jgi:MarR family transcriptional regulator, organic hydroperoxide resistance regulator
VHLDEALDFMRAVWLFNHRLETMSKTMVRRIGLTGPQRMALRIAGRNPGIAAGALAEILHVHPGTLSSALRHLERKGLLVREADQLDRRRVLIHLTPAGKKLDIVSAGTAESGIRAALAEMSPARVGLMRQALLAIARHLEIESERA